MSNDVESLVLARCHKITCDDFKIFIAYRKRMSAGGISRTQASHTVSVSGLQKMQQMFGPNTNKKTFHPFSSCDRVGRDIEDN